MEDHLALEGSILCANIIKSVQEEGTLIDYEKAFKLQAFEFCWKVRRDNPSLADQFDAVESKVNADTH